MTNTLLPLANPLVEADQLRTTSSQLDGIPSDLEQSLRFVGARLIQAAGIYLHIPQELLAQAVVIFYRFYVGAEGGSFFVDGVQDIAAGCTYLVTKPSSCPISPRTMLNAYAYLCGPSSPFPPGSSFTNGASAGQEQTSSSKFVPAKQTLDDATYQVRKDVLFQNEARILRAIGFNTTFMPPHRLALTYLRTLSLLPAQATPPSANLVERVIGHLNAALLSPQLLYLTHQSNSLATASIYLAARESNTAVVSGGEEWWQVFDVDREELGFLVVAFLSVQKWVEKEHVAWKERGSLICPLDVSSLEKELVRRKGS